MLDIALNRLRTSSITRLNKGMTHGELPADTPCKTMGSQIITLIAGIIVLAKGNAPKKK